MDLNPVFASKTGAIAADVRIVVDFSPPPARFRPSHDDIVRDMNRIMKPDAVAVIGASAEEGKIGNSVMKNLINGGYQGEIYPINPSAGEIMGRKAYKSVKDVPGKIDVAVFAIPAKFVAQALIEVRREENPRRGADPVGLRRDRQRRGAEGNPGDRSQVRRAADGPEHLRVLLHVEEPLRDFLHRLRRQGPRGPVVAVGRHRHGDHRVFALGQDGRLGDRRPGQQVRHRRGRPADVLRAGREHAHHRAALRGPQGRPRLRRGRQAGLEKEAGRGAQGGPNQHGGARRELAHRRARRQRQDLRGRIEAVGRHPRQGAARHARDGARNSEAALRPRGRTC